ncbi:chaperone protein EcpD [Providencia alcalifaciens]|nr:chaperone protein EcpD [Providencia alcalifaciens]
MLASQGYASLIINNTRVIYNEQDGESIIKLENNNKVGNPILVQVWMDNGDSKADPSNISVPFNINPSIFRIDGQKGQSLRVMKINDIVDSDKETIFWINFLDIPQKNANGDDNSMQLSIRNRLKFFYRPKNLSINIYDAYKLVQLNFVDMISDYKITIDNPTPYYMTFGHIDVKSMDDKVTYASMNSKDDLMLEPFSKKNLTLKKKNNSSGNVKIHYSLVNDFGSESKYIKNN